MITLEQYYMGRDISYGLELTPDLMRNAKLTVSLTNHLMESYMRETAFPCPSVRSGWRPAEVNAKTPHAAKLSRHVTCQAIDLSDVTGRLKSWVMDNLDLCEEIGLWVEAPEFTPSWCHLQTLSPKSGHRVFIP